MSRKTAVVLFNLGGPDGPDDVQPFLKNLFSDPAIIRSPAPVRWFLSRLISSTRAEMAKENYARMGGGSPLLPETMKQAHALEASLIKRGLTAKTFIAMRYWSPFAADTVRAVEDWGADDVVLLPLYPQFSTTTTASSFKSWRDAGGRETAAICCYPGAGDFVAAHAAKIIETWEKAGKPGNVRLLLSAHGLPEQIITSGDPYEWQVEHTVAAVRALMPKEWEIEVCYQSRVGRLKWIGPATDACIEQAAKDGKTIIVAPIAFVSEHIETLVELDYEYRLLAEQHGAKHYLRPPALGVTEGFIETLAGLVEEALGDKPELGPRSHCGGRICPNTWSACPNSRPLLTDQPGVAT